MPSWRQAFRGPALASLFWLGGCLSPEGAELPDLAGLGTMINLRSWLFRVRSGTSTIAPGR